MTNIRYIKPLAAATVGMSIWAGALGASLPVTAFHLRSTAGVQADYDFQTGSFMRHTAYHHPDSVSKDADANGAYTKINIDYDQNHEGNWLIEQQREGWHTIAAGIANSDTDAIDRGLKILNWGWQQQQPDGGFSCGKSLGQAFHSTAFFVEASAHACLLLQNSPYASQYQSQVDDMKPKLVKAAHWMIANEEEGKRYNRPYTHRRYMVADALGETGVLCGDHDLIDHSKEYVRDGLSMQDPSGFNPEKGGFDVSYNAGGLFFAEEYYNIVADGNLRDRLYSMLQKSIAWQATHVRPDGSIDTSGSTRVNGVNSEIGPGGKRKKVAIGEVYESFAYWAAISGDKSYEELAEKVAHGPRDED